MSKMKDLTVQMLLPALKPFLKQAQGSIEKYEKEILLFAAEEEKKHGQPVGFLVLPMNGTIQAIPVTISEEPDGSAIVHQIEIEIKDKAYSNFEFKELANLIIKKFV